MHPGVGFDVRAEPVRDGSSRLHGFLDNAYGIYVLRNSGGASPGFELRLLVGRVRSRLGTVQLNTSIHLTHFPKLRPNFGEARSSLAGPAPIDFAAKLKKHVLRGGDALLSGLHVYACSLGIFRACPLVRIPSGMDHWESGSGG